VTGQERKVDPKAAEGCMIAFIALIPATGACLLLMGLIKSYLVDSWLVAIGVGLLIAFPTWGYAMKYINHRVRKGEQKIRERKDRERGILEGD